MSRQATEETVRIFDIFIVDFQAVAWENGGIQEEKKSATKGPIKAESQSDAFKGKGKNNKTQNTKCEMQRI